MKTLTNDEKQTIVDTAKEHFDGDLQLGAAAHVLGLGVVKDVGKEIALSFADEAIAAVHKQIENWLKPKKKKPATGGAAKK